MNTLKSFITQLRNEMETNFIKVTMAEKHDKYNTFVIEPAVDQNIGIELLKTSDTKYATVLDEHGKLLYVASFSKGIFNTKVDYMPYKSSQTKMLQNDLNHTQLEYHIEDYKLKKIIARLENIIVNEHDVTPQKVERGSTDPAHLLWMLQQIKSQHKTIAKRANWLGLIQGVLASKNLIDMKHERDIMNAIF